MSRAIFVDLCVAREDAASSSLSSESHADHCDTLIERIFNVNEAPQPDRVEVCRGMLNLESVKYCVKLRIAARERDIQLARLLTVHEILHGAHTTDKCKTRASDRECAALGRSCWLVLRV